MQPSLSLVFALLTASAWAAPGSKCKKAVCNADNCLRAVRASSAKPFPSSASADCSSFMQKTVTPCAVTSTTTRTVTVTGQPAGVTVTTVVPQTQLDTVFETIVSVVTTIEDTATVVEPTEVVVTNIIVSPVTVTAPAANKRAADNLVPLPTLPIGPALVKERAVVTASTCPAATGSPTSVPTYASACSGTARYSSACSCAGYTGATTTLMPVTSTATATSTVTVTPTTTATAAVITTVPVTLTQTQVVPTTFETTDATLIIPSFYTVTTDVVVPTTVVVAPPVCSSYKFVVTNGGLAGQFITGNLATDTLSYGFVTTAGNAASAISFVVRPDGTVYGSNQDRWITRANQFYYVLQTTDQYTSIYNIDDVICAVGAGDSAYPNAAGSLTCTTGGHATNFYNCPQTGQNLVQDTTSPPAGCTQLNIAAILAC